MRDFFQRNNKRKIKKKEEAVRDFDTVKGQIIEEFQRNLREHVYQRGMNEEELRRRIERKKQLRTALRKSVYGDWNSKLFLKDYIRELLLSYIKVDRQNIEELVPFEHPELLSVKDKFFILLLFYEKDYGKKGFEMLLKEELFQEADCITDSMMEELYRIRGCVPLDFSEKMELLSQKIYQSYKGFGVIDRLREFEIDGISSGVSGKLLKNPVLEGEGSCVWIFFHGRSICLDFLRFESESELIRVCRNIYRFRSPGQLSENRGYIVNEMEDGARVSVCRPPFSEHWAFFIRKFDSFEQKTLSELVTDPGREDVILVLTWIIKGCQVTGITGEQGAGKTTLLMVLAGLISKNFNLRVQELSFELHLRNLYPERNILSFCETETISGQEGLDFQKKTDGTVHILGEVASLEVSAWLVQMAQTASRFTLFTHHAKTVDTLVASLRNALSQKGGFQNEQIAQMQVVSAIRFDVHLAKDANGHRYVERISEIIPRYENFQESSYEVNDILIYENGRYHRKHFFSGLVTQEIKRELTKDEEAVFLEKMKGWER